MNLLLIRDDKISVIALYKWPATKNYFKSFICQDL